MGNQLVWSMGSRVREGMCTILCLAPIFSFLFEVPVVLDHHLASATWLYFPVHMFVCHILHTWILLHYSWNLMFQSLASQVRKQLHGSRMEGKPVEGFNHSTSSLLARYLAVRPFAMSSFPILTITTKFISKEKKIESTYTWFILFVGPATHPLWQYRAAEGVAWDVPHSNFQVLTWQGSVQVFVPFGGCQSQPVWQCCNFVVLCTPTWRRRETGRYYGVNKFTWCSMRKPKNAFFRVLGRCTIKPWN